MLRTLYFGLLLTGGLHAAAAAEPVDSVLARAEALIRGDDLEGARKLLTTTRQESPSDVRVRYQLGYVLFRERRLELAKAEFETAVRLAPPALHSRYYLGRIALLENHPKKAAEWLEPVAGADPPIFDALAQLGKAYSDSGQLDKAAETLQSVIRQQPWDGAPHYQLGRIYQRLGQASLAREEFSVSERLKSTDREVVQKLLEFSKHLAKGEKGPAVQIYAELTEDARLDPDVLIALGVLLGNAGLEDEALQTFELAGKRKPDLFEAQYNSGLTLLKLGRTADAQGPLTAAVRLVPESFEAVSYTHLTLPTILRV